MDNVELCLLPNYIADKGRMYLCNGCEGKYDSYPCSICFTMHDLNLKWRLILSGIGGGAYLEPMQEYMMMKLARIHQVERD